MDSYRGRRDHRVRHGNVQGPLHICGRIKLRDGESIKIHCTSAFRRNLKKCQKEHKSLFDDLDSFTRVVTGLQRSTASSVRMQDVGASHGVFMPILKEQKFACKSAGAKGIYRVVYSIDKYSLLLIDIYHKGSQENPDVELIKRNMKGIRESKIMVEGWYEIRAGSCRNLYLNDDHDDG